MKKRLALGIGIGILSLSHQYACATTWMVKNTDMYVSNVITRWAIQEGKQAVWAAHDDVRITDASKWNMWTQLHNATSLDDAVQKILRVVPTMSTIDDKNNSLKYNYLTACMYKQGHVAIVISDFNTSNCQNQVSSSGTSNRPMIQEKPQAVVNVLKRPGIYFSKTTFSPK